MPRTPFLIALFLLAILSARADERKDNDCVPLAFTKLSIILNEKIPYSTWEDGLVKNGNISEFGDAVIFWQDHSKYKLILVYADPLLHMERRDEVPEEGYYLWIGKMKPEQLQKPSSAIYHMTLLKFSFKDHVLIKATLISPYDPKDMNKMIEETVEMPEFFDRTAMILRPEIINN